MFEWLLSSSTWASAILEICIMLLWAFILWFLFWRLVWAFKTQKIITQSDADKIKNSYTLSKQYWLYDQPDNYELESHNVQKIITDTQAKTQTASQETIDNYFQSTDVDNESAASNNQNNYWYMTDITSESDMMQSRNNNNKDMSFLDNFVEKFRVEESEKDNSLNDDFIKLSRGTNKVEIIDNNWSSWKTKVDTSVLNESSTEIDNKSEISRKVENSDFVNISWMKSKQLDESNEVENVTHRIIPKQKTSKSNASIDRKSVV